MMAAHMADDFPQPTEEDTITILNLEERLLRENESDNCHAHALASGELFPHRY